MKKLILALIVVSAIGCEKNKFEECHCENDGVITYMKPLNKERQNVYNYQVQNCLQQKNCTLIK